MNRTGSHPWWQSAVVYQVYPRSFADSTGNGVGDLTGVRRHLDHLELLGVDVLWISPVYPSPMADNGYDISNYCDVDPLFGALLRPSVVDHGWEDAGYPHGTLLLARRACLEEIGLFVGDKRPGPFEMKVDWMKAE